MKKIKYGILIELERNVNNMLYMWAESENVASVSVNLLNKYNDKKVIFGVNYGCCGTLETSKIDVVIKMLDYAKKWAEAMNKEDFEIDYSEEE